MIKTTIKELNSLKTNELIGISQSNAVPFKDVLKFANLLGDKQWIHTDKEKCQKESPFKTPIVHGYLLLGLIPNVINTLLNVTDAKARINYGLNNVRFPEALKVDEKFQVRLVFISSFDKQNHSGTKFKITFEPIDHGKPFCLAELLYIWVRKKK